MTFCWHDWSAWSDPEWISLESSRPGHLWELIQTRQCRKCNLRSEQALRRRYTFDTPSATTGAPP